jgi:hypothetical protein
MRETVNAYKIRRKLLGKRPLGRPCEGWNDTVLISIVKNAQIYLLIVFGCSCILSYYLTSLRVTSRCDTPVKNREKEAVSRNYI